MIDIVPAVNEKTFKEVTRAIDMVAPYTSWIHLDVSDGTLTHNITSWNTPEPLQHFERNIEVHCMVLHPEHIARSWAHAGAARILVHIETLHVTENIHQFLNCEGYAGEIGVVCAVDTPLSLLTSYLHPENKNILPIRYVQFLAVPPGLSGQQFDMRIIQSIISLRAQEPEIIIAVDGGISLENARIVKNAGANILISHKYIFTHSSIKEAFQVLRAA